MNKGINKVVSGNEKDIYANINIKKFRTQYTPKRSPNNWEFRIVFAL